MNRSTLPDTEVEVLQAEIVRLNKIIQALMNRAERSSRIQGSAFNLFETAVVLEDQIRRRTAELEAALEENKKVNRELQLAKRRMEAEIQHRIEVQRALEVANSRLEALNITEPLTGLANRRGLEEALAMGWQKAESSQALIGAAMVDVDKFKLYNDRYGHLQGDECLRRIADALRQVVRKSDLVARYGGEEIVLILPGADDATALQAAERARKAVYDLRIPHRDGPEGVVTVSIGVATLVPTDGLAPETLLRLADEALYRAKAGGRNRVCLFDHAGAADANEVPGACG